MLTVRTGLSIRNTFLVGMKNEDSDVNEFQTGRIDGLMIIDAITVVFSPRPWRQLSSFHGAATKLLPNSYSVIQISTRFGWLGTISELFSRMQEVCVTGSRMLDVGQATQGYHITDSHVTVLPTYAIHMLTNPTFFQHFLTHGAFSISTTKQNSG